MKIILVTLICFLVAGCSGPINKEDFESLSSYERAALICASTDQAKGNGTQVEALKVAIKEKTDLLNRGMRTARTCRLENQSECATCAVKLKNVCTDHAVAIDSTYEAKVRDEYREQLALLLSKEKSRLDDCQRKVLKLPANEAYGLYKSSIEPL